MRNFRAGLIAAAALIGLLSASPSANALTWTLSGATFDDGGALVGGGYFAVGTPAEPYADYTNFSVTTTGGTTLLGDSYYAPAPASDRLLTYPIGSSSPTYNAIEFYANDNVYERVLLLVFQNSLLYPGTDPLVAGLSGTYECFGFSCDPLVGGPGTGPTRYILATTPAFATATPLPSTWVMMLTGLAGFGFIAYRWKKNLPSLAAA